MDRLVFFLIFIILVQITTSLDICTKEAAESGRQVVLNGKTYATTPCVCNVSARPVTGFGSVPVVNVTQNKYPVGCQYQLELHIGNKTIIHSCTEHAQNNNDTIVFYNSRVFVQVILKNYMYKNNTNTGFEFSLTFTLSEIGSVYIRCFRPQEATTSATKISTTNYLTDTIFTSSPTTPSTQAITESHSPTSSTISDKFTERSGFLDNNLADEESESNSLSVITGSTVGAIVFIIIMVVIVFVLKKRKHKNEVGRNKNIEYIIRTEQHNISSDTQENGTDRHLETSNGVYVNADLNPDYVNVSTDNSISVVNADLDPDYINSNSANTTVIVQDRTTIPVVRGRNQGNANSVYDSLKEPENQYEKPVIYSRLDPDSNYQVLQKEQENHYEYRKSTSTEVVVPK